MDGFERLSDGLYLLKVPFGSVWTGVFLIDGAQKVLVDSGPDARSVDEYIVPALEALGVEPGDIAWLINTHSHGDHMGGNDRLLTLAPRMRLAAFSRAAEKLADPLPYSIKTRTKYPAFSPAPPTAIPGHRAELLLEDGDVLAGRLQVIHTPGHDTECITLLNLPTRTLLTGDSMQAFGDLSREGAGMAFYKDLPAYLASIEKLRKVEAENLIASHAYRPMAGAAFGAEQVRTYLDACALAPRIYTALVERITASGVTAVQDVALAVLDALGTQPPRHLFQPMYSVEEHLKLLG